MSSVMSSKKLLSLSFLGLAMSLSNSVTAGSIINSAHDFTSATGGAWSTQICLACHTPHNASNQQNAPLWGHDTTTAAFTLYTGIVDAAGAPTTLNATINTPTGTSLLCLSCHDGTVALDSFGGTQGTVLINGGVAGGSNVGTDLSNDHPISFDYTTALATADGSLHDPATAPSNLMGKTTTTNAAATTIANDLLEGGIRMECSSCHDVHNTFTGPAAVTGTNMLLKVDIAGSKLCLTCHDK